MFQEIFGGDEKLTIARTKSIRLEVVIFLVSASEFDAQTKKKQRSGE